LFFPHFVKEENEVWWEEIEKVAPSIKVGKKRKITFKNQAQNNYNTPKTGKIIMKKV
jgi:hypothetical protein